MASINIGETLRKARIDKKISLDELQQRTKIQKRYLLAIEENDFHELPSDYYLRTFIRQYADEVKLDGNYLIDVLDGKDRPMPTYPELETVDGIKLTDRFRRVSESGVFAINDNLRDNAYYLFVAFFCNKGIINGL